MAQVRRRAFRFVCSLQLELILARLASSVAPFIFAFAQQYVVEERVIAILLRERVSTA